MGTLALVPIAPTMTLTISIPGVCERDVDLLLLEEFVASSEFIRWFFARVASSTITVEKLLSAKRSVTQLNGESDLEILLQDSTAGQNVYLLIENKVNAALQPRQAERYRERGQNYQQSGNCTSFYTILVAPERYFGSDTALKGFDARVTYEEIVSWFRSQKQDAERQRYKLRLLQAAIEKGTVGYQMVPDDPITNFWHRYWQLSQEQASVLNMQKPGSKPARSSRVPFKPVGLPKDVTLVHDLNNDNVALLFSNMGEKVNKLRELFKLEADNDMHFEKAYKSGCIRLKVPCVNAAHDFDDQREKCIQGMNAAMRLLRLYEKVCPASSFS